MKFYINKGIVNASKHLSYLVMLVFVLVSCYPSPDLDPIDSPDDNPLPTITPGGTYTTISEGDTLKYTITVDKPVRYAVQFGVTTGDGHELAAEDVEIIGGLLAPYELSTELWVIMLADNFPETSETVDIVISADEDITWNFQLNPAYEPVAISSVALSNTNDEGGITVAVSWPDPAHEIDFDLFVESETNGTWSIDGATGSNPEIDVTVRHDYDPDPAAYDDTYYFAIDPYDVPDGDIPFTVHVGFPDGTVESFDGVFNKANIGDYTPVTISAYAFDANLVLTVVKTGSSYTATFAF